MGAQHSEIKSVESMTLLWLCMFNGRSAGKVEVQIWGLVKKVIGQRICRWFATAHLTALVTALKGIMDKLTGSRALGMEPLLGQLSAISFPEPSYLPSVQS